LTTETFNEILNNQKGKCAICGKVPSGNGIRARLAIDHDHSTGKVRGLLFHECNIMLGAGLDNISILESAIHYLTYHSLLKMAKEEF
jgi:hypothetical protein